MLHDFFTLHVITYDRLKSAKVFERARDSCRLVKTTRAELLPTDTF